jgi:ATP-dependent Clp protease protease subunit
MLNGAVTEDSASVIVAQFLYLQSEDDKADINFYINSGGGLVTAGLSIYDTMNLVNCDVATYCHGQAASMGAFLLSGGAKGKRFALPSSRIMIHQPLGGASGQASDIVIQADEIVRLKKFLQTHIAEHTGKKYSTIENDCNRDNYMSAQEALKYGLIDQILPGRKK